MRRLAGIALGIVAVLACVSPARANPAQPFKSVTYPDGTVVHGDWLCVITPAAFVDAIAPGTYGIALTWRSVSLDVESGMASDQWRAGHCPAGGNP